MKKIIFILTGILLWSCSGDSSSDTQFEPEITSFNFEERLPQNMQNDAPIIYSQVMSMQGQMNAMGAFMTNNGYMNRTANEARTTSDWSYGDFDVEYSYDLVGNQYQFYYTISYQGAVYYTIEGWQMVDGSSGYWASTVDFEALGQGMENMPDYTTEVSWASDANGLNMEMSFDFGDTMQIFYEMTINNDGSGYFAYTLNGDLTYSALWSANGTGLWTNHTTNPPTVTTW